MRTSSVLLVTLLPLLTLTAQGQGGVGAIKASVVKITSKAPEGQPRTGTGFVVRVDGDIIYIATAAHVVEGDPKPQVTFYHDQLRPVAAEVGALELDNPTTGLGYVVVRDRAIAGKVTALPWNTETPNGGEPITTIGFGQGGGPWSVVTGTVSSLSGADIKIDGRIEQGNSGGPILLNGEVVGMVTASGTFGIGKSAIIVQATLRGWNIDISATPAGASGPSSTPRDAWDARIRNGTGFAVLFDALEQAQGTIKPGEVYVVHFNSRNGQWKASGAMYPSGYQVDIATPASPACDPHPDTVFCIWGAPFRYDQDGQVFLNTRRRVGRLQSLTRRDRVRSGEPFKVIFDALVDPIGTIRPEATYDVSFLPVERAWQASGPTHQGSPQNVTVPAADVCDPANYDLCIWGAAFRYDEGGQVFRQSLRVGRIP